MLPVVEPDPRSTARHILFYSVLLIPVSLLPKLLGMTGWMYAVGAIALGLWFLHAGVQVSLDRSRIKAHKVLLTSVVYLPAIYALMVLDPAWL